MSQITIKTIQQELRVDSRVIAKKLGVDHKATIQLIDRYREQVERFGPLPFKMRVVKRPQGGGTNARYALLNRSQAELLLSLSRNTPEAVELKVQLIIAFDKAREALEASGNYIPFYRAAHDSLQALVEQSGSSTPASIHHMNFEKLINRTFGISPGTRQQLEPEIQLMLGSAMALANRVYRDALNQGQDHKQAYQIVKNKIEQHMLKHGEALQIGRDAA